MNRIPRRGRLPQRRNESLNRFKQTNKVKSPPPNAVETLHSPPLSQTHHSTEKTFVNRCCYVSPIKRDFGQYYSSRCSPRDSKDSGQVKQLSDQNQLTTKDKDKYYGHGPILPNITHVKELKKVSCGSSRKVKNRLPHISRRPDNSQTNASNGLQWQTVDSAEDVDKLISGSDLVTERSSKHMFISDVPRVKVIAEKFSKYKKNNLELRRLDEKLVCVEYDICSQSSSNEDPKPVQRMRAFFSIKPSIDDRGLPKLPSNIKNEFEVMDEDLKKLTDKEIEFIDSKIEENKSYLEDLKRILKRKQVVHAKKNKNNLDLKSLYEMAKRDRSPLNCDFSHTNLLSKAELQEVKDLILQRCTSSVHGFSRRTIKSKEDGLPIDISVISDNFMTELLR